MFLYKYLPGRIVEPLLRYFLKAKKSFKFHGYYFINTNDYLCFLAGVVDNYEPELIRTILNLPKKNVYYDVGCNQGLLSIPFTKRFSEIYSFDGSQDMIKKLKANIKFNNLNNIKPVNILVSDYVGKLKFYISKSYNSGTSSTIYKENRSSNKKNGIEQICTTLDNFVYKLGNNKPDLIKIDVEGAEEKVLIGANRLILEHSPIIIVEIRSFNVLKRIKKILPKFYNLQPIYQVGPIGFIKKIIKLKANNYIARPNFEKIY